LDSIVLYRRSAGVTAALLMFQLALAGGELVCPRHSDESGSGAGVPVAAESHGAHEHAHRGSDQAPPPNEHHPSPDCCPAMNTCSNSAAIQSGSDVLATPSSRYSVATHVASLPLSRVESPDPPPPKA
ncbi:MAG TPA: hypothetical protein VF128_15845, partial [Gemmatimonadaceae bacterium]